MNNNEGEWITVTSKKKRNNKNKRTPFDKTKVKLWYDTSTWQHKVLTNSYKYNDGSTVLDKFNLAEMHERYLKTQSNYDKNYFCKKLMKVISEHKWKEEEPLVTENNQQPKVEQQTKVEQQSVEQPKVEETVVQLKSVETSVNSSSDSKCKEGISWASVV